MKVIYSADRQTLNEESNEHLQKLQEQEKSSLLARAMLVCILLCLGVMLIARVLLAKNSSTDVTGLETNVVHGMQALLSNGRLYFPANALPDAIAQYSPLFYYLCAATAWLFDLGPGNVHELYLIGSLWNILISSASLLAVYLIMNHVLRVNLVLAAVAALGAFILQPKLEHSVFADNLYEAMTIWGVYFFLQYLAHKRESKDVPEYLYLAMCLAVASMFVEQSGVQLPILMGAFLLFTNNWRGTWFFFLSSTILFTCLLGFFWGLYGEAFLQSVVSGAASGMALGSFGGSTLKLDDPGDFPIMLVRLLIPAALGVILSLYRWLAFKGNLLERFFAFSILGMLAFAVVKAVQVGFDVQHFYISFLLTFLFALYSFWKKARLYTGGSLSAARLQTAFAMYVCMLLVFNTAEDLSRLKHKYLKEVGAKTEDAMVVRK